MRTKNPASPPADGPKFPPWAVAVVVVLIGLFMLTTRGCTRRDGVEGTLTEESGGESTAAQSTSTPGAAEDAHPRSRLTPDGSPGGSVPGMMVATSGDGPVAESGPPDVYGKHGPSAVSYEGATGADFDR